MNRDSDLANLIAEYRKLERAAHLSRGLTYEPQYSYLAQREGDLSRHQQQQTVGHHEVSEPHSPLNENTNSEGDEVLEPDQA
jgi:hypothetical protein